MTDVWWNFTSSSLQYSYCSRMRFLELICMLKPWLFSLLFRRSKQSTPQHFILETFFSTKIFNACCKAIFDVRTTKHVAYCRRSSFLDKISGQSTEFSAQGQVIFTKNMINAKPNRKINLSIVGIWQCNYTLAFFPLTLSQTILSKNDDILFTK